MKMRRFAALVLLLKCVTLSQAEYTMSIHFFNVDNPEEIIAGELPVMSQRGPYVYREEREKRNEEQEGDLLTFGEYKEYKFDSELSCEGCSEDDEVRILNLPLIGVVQECLNQGSLIGGILCGLVEAALHGEFQVGRSCLCYSGARCSLYSIFRMSFSSNTLLVTSCSKESLLVL